MIFISAMTKPSAIHWILIFDPLSASSSFRVWSIGFHTEQYEISYEHRTLTSISCTGVDVDPREKERMFANHPSMRTYNAKRSDIQRQIAAESLRCWWPIRQCNPIFLWVRTVTYCIFRSCF